MLRRPRGDLLVANTVGPRGLTPKASRHAETHDHRCPRTGLNQARRCLTVEANVGTRCTSLAWSRVNTDPRSHPAPVSDAAESCVVIANRMDPGWPKTSGSRATRSATTALAWAYRVADERAAAADERAEAESDRADAADERAEAAFERTEAEPRTRGSRGPTCKGRRGELERLRRELEHLRGSKK